MLGKVKLDGILSLVEGWSGNLTYMHRKPRARETVLAAFMFQVPTNFKAHPAVFLLQFGSMMYTFSCLP